MKELEEVNCEIQKVIDLQHLISDRLNNTEDNDYASSLHMQDYEVSKNPLGGFLHGTTYAWMSHGCHLIVLNVKSGESINCCWTFRERITCVAEFPTQAGHLPLLLVGLDNGSNRIKDSMGLLCVFDCNTSRVLRAIRTPAGVEQVCIVSGGAHWEEINDKRSDNIFSGMDGVACVVLRNLQHIMIDLRRSLWDDPNCITYMDEISPVELTFSLEKNSNDRSHFVKEKHMAYNLLDSSIEKRIGFNRAEFELSSLISDNLIPTIICSTKIGCLISGCLGRVIIWQNNGSIGWFSRPIEEKMTITHLSLLEPTDDPRPFYYLWVVYQDESSKIPPILRMYALLFQRKYCDKGTSLYFNLEAEPCLRFEFELEKGNKIISLSPIEREVNPDQTDSNTKRGEDNLLLIATNERILLFDLNQWYKEQMPQTIYDCKNPNSILATYRTSLDINHTGDKLISCSYVPSTLREFPINSPCPAEELFYPNSLSFEWVELSTAQLVFWMTRGIQAELLRKMAIAGPIILLQPMEIFHKCLSVGLIPFNTELSFANDENTQREVLLSLCLEQRWVSFLVKCAKEWSDGSASFLYPSFLKWGIQRASSIKMIADRLCIPLFDQSDSSIGEAEIKTLRFCSQQLECLSNVVANLMLDTDDMIKQRKALKHISTYLQVLLWFYDVGLLPEIQELEEERQLPMSLSFRIPYPYEKLMSIYTQKRDAINSSKTHLEEDEGLFIDILINKECPILKSQWERESGDISTDGYYPPSSLQSLVRSYLTDCHQAEINETECKHQITIYLLMDLAMLLQGSYPGVDQLIKYPSAFKMSPSLIKLTQAFWLLDHEDYQGFLDMMTGQLVLDSDVKSWHHKLVLRTLVRNNQQKLALIYLRIRKPPISSTSDQSTIVNLSVQHGLVQSAFHCRPPSHYVQLLRCFFEACKLYNKLGDILHLTLEPEEEEVFVKFLQEDTSENIKTLYYLQRCRYAELNNKNALGQFKNNIPKNMLPTSVAMLAAYDATLPAITKQFSSGITKTNLEMDLESKYPRPLSHYKCINKQQSIYETVIKKAKETSFQSRKCRIPFITAPCSSLRTNESNINISCVLFPTLAQMSRNKRTFDDIYDSEDNSNVTLEETKRRKLSNSKDSSNTPCHNNLNVTFDTPLVKRKSNTSNHKGTPIGTPHSILKIRQLIQNSSSPHISITHSVDAEDNVSLEKEKKINRQIRFNISNSKKNTIITHEDINEEDANKDISFTKDTSEEGTDIFLSPNDSIKSTNETTMLLSDSSYMEKSSYCPRPRPSLRRSYLLGKNTSDVNNLANVSSSSSDLLNSLKDSSTCVEEINKQTFPTSPSRSRAHHSLSATMYSTMILSPGSSFDRSSLLENVEDINTADQLALSAKTHNYNNTVSSTPLTKHRVNETSNDSNEEKTSMEHTSEGFVGNLTRDVHIKVSKDNNPTLIQDSLLKEINENKYNDENECKFESLSNSLEHEFQPTYSEMSKDFMVNYNKSSNGIQIPEKITSNFDITDDESSNDSNNIRLMLNEQNENINEDSMIDSANTISHPIQHFSDVSNITEDGSSNSNDIKEFKSQDNISVRSNDINTKQMGKVNELQKFGETDLNLKDSSSDSIRRELSSEQVVMKQDVSKNKVRAHNVVDTCMVKLHKISISTEIKKTMTLEESSFSEKISETKKSKKENTVKKQVTSVKNINDTTYETIDDLNNVKTTPITRKTRSSSVTKDILSVIEEDSHSEIEKDKQSNRRNTRRATSVQKEVRRVSTPIVKRTRSASIFNVSEGKDVNLIKSKLSGQKPSTSKKEEEEEKEKPRGSRLTRGTSTSSITEASEKQEEETNTRKLRGRRGNSLPKESSAPKITRRERASSVIPDIPEEPLTSVLESKRRRSSISSKVIEEFAGSPATNTRSRRSSIQSIPEELEHVLNSPITKKSQNLSEAKETLTTTRTRRATSVDSSSVDIKKRTRNLRSRNIIEDAILEESTEAESNTNIEITKGKTSKRKKTSSTTENQIEQEDTKEKPKKGKTKLSADDKKKEFLFSQPDKMEDQPNESSVGEVPNYIFSPPQTRSRNTNLKEISRTKYRSKVNFLIPQSIDNKQLIERKTVYTKSDTDLVRLLLSEQGLFFLRDQKVP